MSGWCLLSQIWSLFWRLKGSQQQVYLALQCEVGFRLILKSLWPQAFMPHPSKKQITTKQQLNNNQTTSSDHRVGQICIDKPDGARRPGQLTSGNAKLWQLELWPKKSLAATVCRSMPQYGSHTCIDCRCSCLRSTAIWVWSAAKYGNKNDDDVHLAELRVQDCFLRKRASHAVESKA